jgi:hypothetical protein
MQGQYDSLISNHDINHECIVFQGNLKLYQVVKFVTPLILFAFLVTFPELVTRILHFLPHFHTPYRANMMVNLVSNHEINHECIAPR